MNNEISEAKLAANRANAQKSTGPRTEQGKAISSQNAVKHGFYTHTYILDGEGEEEFEALYNSYMNRLRPIDDLEVELVVSIIMLEWQIRRYRIADNTVLLETVMNPKLGGFGFQGTGTFRLARAIETVAEKPVSRYLTRKLASMGRELAQMLKNFFLLRKNAPPAPAQPWTRDDLAKPEKTDKNEPTSPSVSLEPGGAQAIWKRWSHLIPKVMTAGATPPHFDFA